MQLIIHQDFFANQLNEQINVLLWQSMPLHWNIKKSKWEFTERQRLPYFSKMFGLKFIGLVGICYAIILGLQNPGLCSASQLMSMVIHGLFLVTLIIADVLACLDGKEVLKTINWCYLKERWCHKYGLLKLGKKYSAISNGMVVSLVLAFLLFSIAEVYANLDHIYFLLEYFYPQRADQPLVKVLRYFVVGYFIQTFTIIFRTICLIVIMSGFYRIEFLHLLSKSSLSRICVSLYHENALVMKLIYNFDYKCETAVLSGLFVLLCTFINAMVLAYEKQLGSLIFMCGLCLIISLVLLNTMFGIGYTYFEQSQIIKHRWYDEANRCSSRRERIYFQRVVKSLPLITIPAGMAGILDRDIKIHYIEKLLGNSVDSIVTRRNTS